MNRYMEGVVLGLIVAVVGTVVGVGAPRANPLLQSVLTPSAVERTASRALEAPQRVDVRPRVSGRIVSVSVVPNQEVHQGEVLMRVDPQPYQASYNKARRKLTEAQWRYEEAVSARTRATNRSAADPGFRDELNLRIAAAEQASATVHGDQAALAEAQRNLEYTAVIAPISGIVGRAGVSIGSVVHQNQTVLLSVTAPRAIIMSSSGY